MDKKPKKIIGISGRAQAGKDTLAEYISEQWSLQHVNCEILHMADELKSLCKKFFNLSDHQINDKVGKNEPTHLRWEDVQGLSKDKHVKRDYFMTGREVLEIVGTHYLRKLDPRCHIKTVLYEIEQSDFDFYLVPDIRAENEVQAIHDEGGIVVRLTRNPENRQTEIERYLDPDNFDWNRFDLVIDNRNLDVDTKNKLALIKIEELLKCK